MTWMLIVPAIHLTAHRNYQDRLLFQMQYFHGSLDSTRLHLRAMAIWNFHPYSSGTKAITSRSSPLKNLMAFVITTIGYATHCWLNQWLLARLFERFHKIR